MGLVKALLVSVSEYAIEGCAPLPLCKNDLYEMKNALVSGLNVVPNNIILCGESGTVKYSELKDSINKISDNFQNDDTFIFYFSGHGGNKCLALTDVTITFQNILNSFKNFSAKNKIIIIDSCHSGSFELDDNLSITNEEYIKLFNNHGFSILASCRKDQYSGFHQERNMSLYTSFVCDALTSPFVNKYGKKSLEDINKEIRYLSNFSNTYNIQSPIYRSNIIGTIFFNVTDYKPYKVLDVFEENENYIIHSIKPIHYSSEKRFKVNIILRFKNLESDIEKIINEIKYKIDEYKVYQNKTVEILYSNKVTDTIFYNFGYNENDIFRSNYIYNAMWSNNLQKYKSLIASSYKTLSKNILIKKNMLYELATTDYSYFTSLELIQQTKEYTASLILLAHKSIQIYREYINEALTLEDFIITFIPLKEDIEKYYYLQSNLPIPDAHLCSWADVHEKISGTIHDFSLLFDNSIEKSNRKELIHITIQNFHSELEELKNLDNILFSY